MTTRAVVDTGKHGTVDVEITGPAVTCEACGRAQVYTRTTRTPTSTRPTASASTRCRSFLTRAAPTGAHREGAARTAYNTPSRTVRRTPMTRRGSPMTDQPSADAQAQIAGLRQRIDDLDTRIVALLNDARATPRDPAPQTAGAPGFYDPKREEEIFAKLADHNEAAL